MSRWTQEDKEIVYKHYKNKPIKEIQKILSVYRTENAISHIVNKAGIRKKDYVKVKDYSKLKYKIIENKLHKLCKKCERYLPSDIDYFPKDNSCVDGIRNVCRECKGEQFVVNSKVHMWSKDELDLLEEVYPYYTNNELVEKFFSFASPNMIMHKSYNLKVYKTEEAIQRALDENGRKHSARLLELNKWAGEDNPQYDSKRFGELNPNYNGGISNLNQELRRNIKQWKLDSLENCNYKCFLTGGKFDHIHHIYSFDLIVEDTLKELNLKLYDDISSYSEDELKSIINKCIEIHYRYPLGVCLSKEYHIKFHEEFGYGNNTPEQFCQFIENYYKGKYSA